MRTTGSIPPLSAALGLMLIAAPLCGCRPAVPDNGSHSSSVVVRPVLQYPLHGEGARYGPGIGAGAGGGLRGASAGLSRMVFEVTNVGNLPLEWVAWNHAFTIQETSQEPFTGRFRIRSLRARRCCVWVGRLAPDESVMCSVELNLGWPGKVWDHGAVTGVLAGTGGRHPKTTFLAAEYTGVEWVVPGSKFVRPRLDRVLARLRSVEPAASEPDMEVLLYASRRVNGGMPVVAKPEIVAAFVDRILKARPREAPDYPDDEEPEPRIVRFSELFDPFEYPLLVLLDLVPPAELRRHAEALNALAVHAKDRRVVELLVKAGSAKALDELAARPERLPAEIRVAPYRITGLWGGFEEPAARPDRLSAGDRQDLLLAVRAGSGDEKAFAALLEAFGAVEAPARKVALARRLALVGREEGLKAVAGQLRDDRPYGLHNGRVVYCDLAAALRLAFPEQPAFYPELRRGERWRAELERFCAGRFGVEYVGELPPGPEPLRAIQADQWLRFEEHGQPDVPSPAPAQGPEPAPTPVPAPPAAP